MKYKYKYCIDARGLRGWYLGNLSGGEMGAACLSIHYTPEKYIHTQVTNGRNGQNGRNG